MIIDANIILRCILNDNEVLSLDAKNIIENYNCFAPTEVVAEVVYVLLKVYNIPRSKIKKALFYMLELVKVENKNVLLQALEYFELTKLDFVDCILATYYFVDGKNVATFDKKLNNFMASL